MKLRDLEPQFLQWYQEPATEEQLCLNPKWQPGRMIDWFRHVHTLAEAHGIRFICPKGLAANDPHEVMIFFAGSPVPAHLGKNKDGQTVRWTATGTGYDDLTLQPSIQEQCGPCGWHGFVTNGDAT